MRVLFCALIAGLLLLGPIAPGPAVASPGMKWGVCIGIGDYQDPDLADLPHAADDARDLARALENRGGFDRVLALTDDASSKDPSYPSRKNLLSALDRVRSKLQREDTLLLFFSGHGVTDPGGRSFLLPADAVVRNIPRTAVPADTLVELVSGGRAGQRILLLDAARREIWRKGPPLQALYPDRYLRDRVSAVFYAAKKGTFSHDHDRAPYGVFGGALIAGVQGEADRDVGGNQDGVVSLMELGAYVDEKVTAWSLESGNRQSPYIRLFESGAATLAMSRSEGAADERVLAAVETPSRPLPEEEAEKRPEAGPKPVIRVVPSERPKPAPEPRIQEPAPGKKPEPAKEIAPAPAPEDAPSEEIMVGAQAPSIEDVDEGTPPELEGRKAAGEPEEAEAPRVAARPSEPEPRQAEAGSPPGDQKTSAPAAPAPAVVEGEKAMEYEAEERRREERVMSGEEAPAVASVPSTGPEDLKPATAPPPKPVSLRSRPTDLSAEAVKALLLENGFYATCWTYNGDFCNPNGAFANDFQDNGDGTVTDRRTRLMWQQGGSPGVIDWTEAGAYVEKLNQERFAGHADWRLPTVEELASLMERSWLNDDLFLAPVFGSGLKYCWSADTKGVERAWKSNFHLGFFLDFPMDELSGVRAVRSIR